MPILEHPAPPLFTRRTALHAGGLAVAASLEAATIERTAAKEADMAPMGYCLYDGICA